jgi:hypothetical protein
MRISGAPLLRVLFAEARASFSGSDGLSVPAFDDREQVLLLERLCEIWSSACMPPELPRLGMISNENSGSIFL